MTDATHMRPTLGTAIHALATGVWLPGAVLTVDLIFQGWGLIAFGVGLKGRASRDSGKPAAV
jgi:hypothetical protein